MMIFSLNYVHWRYCFAWRKNVMKLCCVRDFLRSFAHFMFYFPIICYDIHIKLIHINARWIETIIYRVNRIELFDAHFRFMFACLNFVKIFVTTLYFAIYNFTHMLKYDEMSLTHVSSFDFFRMFQFERIVLSIDLYFVFDLLHYMWKYTSFDEMFCLLFKCSNFDETFATIFIFRNFRFCLHIRIVLDVRQIISFDWFDLQYFRIDFRMRFTSRSIKCVLHQLCAIRCVSYRNSIRIRIRQIFRFWFDFVQTIIVSQCISFSLVIVEMTNQK